MSRYPSFTAPEKPNLAEVYANYVSINAVPNAMKLEEIKQETKHDAEMQAVIKAVETDQWSAPEVQDYKKFKEAQRRTICVQWASAEKEQNCHTI